MTPTLDLLPPGHPLLCVTYSPHIPLSLQHCPNTAKQQIQPKLDTRVRRAGGGLPRTASAGAVLVVRVDVRGATGACGLQGT